MISEKKQRNYCGEGKKSGYFKAIKKSQQERGK